MAIITERFQNISTEQLIRNVFAGVIVGFIDTIITISLASLIFQGHLKSFLPMAMGIGLMSQAVILIFISLFTKTPNLIPSVQDNPSALMAVIAMSLAASVAPDVHLPTVLMMILVTTIVTGAGLIIIGHFRLGQLARYIPYPVIAGFLAGTGWLLLRGSFGIMANASLTIAEIPVLLQPSELLLWLPGIVFGLVLFFGLQRSSNPRTMPLLLLSGIVVFYLALLVTNTSISEAMQRGLLLSQDNTGTYWQPPQLVHFTQADWGAIMRQAPNIITIFMLSVVSLLLYISGLELALKTDIDLNHELRTAGFANILSGLCGGLIGYHTVSLPVISQRIGGRGRLPGIITGLFGLIVLLVGAGLLAYVPRPLLGGMIFFLGLDFLHNWLIEGRKKFSKIDYAIVWMIVLTIAFAGFLMGVALGLVLTIILFVVNYSRINIFHYRSSGVETTSNVERTAYHQESLLKLGQHIEVIELRGFIFFGTVNHLLELIRQRYQDSSKAQLQYLLLDFRRVTGIDSSAALGFQKLQYIAATNNFKLLLTHLNGETRHHFADEGISESDEHVRIFEDLDHGLEWCENELLVDFGVTQARVSIMLEGQLEDRGFDKKLVKPLRDYLERLVIEKGEYLARMGDEASDLYFVEVGQVSIFLEFADGHRVRLRTMQMGTIIGEVGFYLQQKRSASVIADTKVVVYRLTREALERMKTEQPMLALALDELMIRMVAERLARNNRAVEAYSR